MKKQFEIQLDFEIDKLTKSIENAISAESFLTEITQIKSSEKRIIKKADWNFDWKLEIGDKNKFVYKLNTVENPKIIQGLICLTDKGDHIFMDLIESANLTKGKTNFIMELPEI